MSGKGFLCNMTENLQADCVQSRQAGFIPCFLKTQDITYGNTSFYNEAECRCIPASFFAADMRQQQKAIPHKERLATLHAICLQISLQSLFRIFPHASCVHIFRDISGKYSKIHKGFSPFSPSSLKKSDDAICMRQIRNRLSYFTKMLVNTSSIHSAFCFI